jgi:hypothetical protein
VLHERLAGRAEEHALELAAAAAADELHLVALPEDTLRLIDKVV